MAEEAKLGQTAGTFRELILREMRRIGLEHGKAVPDLTDALPLVSTDLDSLCLAILVATLDDTLGLDPFGDGAADFPVTVGDFVAAYERTAP